MNFSTFITTVQQDLNADAQAALAAVKTSAAYVENVVVTEIGPEVGSALVQALEKFGEELFAQLLGQLTSTGTATAPTPASPASVAAS